jgi:hypothetical protein
MTIFSFIFPYMSLQAAMAEYPLIFCHFRSIHSANAFQIDDRQMMNTALHWIAQSAKYDMKKL